MSPAWWTAADQAELDVLIHEFVRAAFRHREDCGVCSASGPWCKGMRQAFDVLIEWRRFRRLLSEAEFLRAGQDLATEAPARAADPKEAA